MKNKDTNTIYQQGDVLIRPIENLPAGTKQVVQKRLCVLAEGEATGHAHVAQDNEAELIRIGERMILSLGRSTTITHEEHKPITLAPGLYDIGRVREYDYFSQMARAVQD